MIEKGHWQKGILLLILVVAIGLFYAVSEVEDAARLAGAGLVTLRDAGTGSGGFPAADQAATAGGGLSSGVETEVVPVSGGRLAPQETAAAGGGLPAAQGLNAEPVRDAASSLMQAVGGRSKSLDAFRLARTVARSRRIEALEQSLALEDLPLERREAIVAELLALVESEEAEQQAEGLLIARGLTDALVYVANQRAEVIVVDRIDREEAGRIGDLVARVVGVSLDRITIVDGAGE